MPRHLMCPTADHLTATTWHDHLFHPPNFAALLKSPLRAYVMMATRTTTESEFFNSNQEAASLLSETEDNKILYTIIRPVTHQNYCYLQSTGRLGVWQLHTASHTLTPPRDHAMLIIKLIYTWETSQDPTKKDGMWRSRAITRSFPWLSAPIGSPSRFIASTSSPLSL